MKSVVETTDSILKALDDNRDALRALGVKRLGLFGLFVRGEQTTASDREFRLHSLRRWCTIL